MESRQQTEMDAETWSSLPHDLLLDIFRRLGSTAVVRCAGACKPWRRTIIGSAASCLRPRPDRFHPPLLLGFFRHLPPSSFYPGSPPRSWFQSADDDDRCKSCRKVSSFVTTSALAGAGADDYLALYDRPLSSRDGLLLLGGKTVGDLCLRNPMTGWCAFLPAAAFEASTYVLITGYDLCSPSCGSASDDDDDLAMTTLILAVGDGGVEHRHGMTYQIFSSATSAGAGAWGPVTRSPELGKGLHAQLAPGSEVVCRGGAVHWLAWSTAVNHLLALYRRPTCTVAIDVRTGRTWTMELPDPCTRLDCFRPAMYCGSLALATSGDGRLAVVGSMSRHRVIVWVYDDDGRTRWRRRIDVRKYLLPHYCPDAGAGHVELRAFCPRSGCVLGSVAGQELLIDVNVDVDAEEETSPPPPPPVRFLGTHRRACHFPYEMDWSTYISKMRQF